MSLPLILSAFWVVAGSAVAMLPMRYQFIPGFLLLLAVPVLIVWIGVVHGWIWAAFGVFAFVSMFRRPLAALLRYLRGRGGNSGGCMIWAGALGCLWLFAANVIAMLPSRDRHWTAAYVLIAIGIPILGFITWKAGPVWGLLFLAGGASVLRWPLIHLLRAVKRRVGAGE